MKIVMYGAPICPACVDAKKKLDNRNDVELDYRNIISSTKLMKEFLSYRDHDEIFAPIIEKGNIGIPFFVLEDGSKTFELPEYGIVEDEESNVQACSIDGKGNC